MRDIREGVTLRRLMLPSLECIKCCIEIIMAYSKKSAISYHYNASHFLLWESQMCGMGFCSSNEGLQWIIGICNVTNTEVKWKLRGQVKYVYGIFSHLAITMTGLPQYSRLKSSMPFKMQPQLEIEDITWSPQYNMHATRINEHRALLLHEMELNGWFLILHIVLKKCTV